MVNILRIGSEGADVVRLRQLLDVFGLAPLLCSDVFDPDLRDAVVDFQMRHSGPDGRPLIVDGIVGAKTWWALQLDPNIEDHSTHGLTTPAGLTPMRRAVLEGALRWLAADVREVPLGSNRGPMIDDCLPKWRTTGKMANAKGPPWCAFCADHIALVATGFHPHVSEQMPRGQKIGSVYRSVQVSKRLGQFVADPTPGDQFAILYRDGSGRLTFKGHKGTVIRVDDTHVNTLEGNYGNAFRAARRARSTIEGYVNWFPLHEQPKDWERGGVIDVQGPQHKTTR